MTTEKAKILSIREAFSMQPYTYFVCTFASEKHLTTQAHLFECCKEIVKFQKDQYEWVYIGYNFAGQKLFEYQEKSVNVHYYYPEP